MSVEIALDRLLVRDEFRQNLTLDHVIPPRAARYAPVPNTLAIRLARALGNRGITRLCTPAKALGSSGKGMARRLGCSQANRIGVSRLLAFPTASEFLG